MPRRRKPLPGGPRICPKCRRQLADNRQKNAIYCDDICRAATNRGKRGANQAKAPDPIPATAAPPAAADSLRARIQALRARAGLPALLEDPGLALQAQAEVHRLAAEAADARLAQTGDPRHAEVQLLASLVPPEVVDELAGPGLDQANVTRCGMAVLPPLWEGGQMVVAVVLQ